MNQAEREALELRLQTARTAEGRLHEFQKLATLVESEEWDGLKVVPRENDGGLDFTFRRADGSILGYAQFPPELSGRLIGELRQALGMIADAGRAEFQKAYAEA